MDNEGQGSRGGEEHELADAVLNAVAVGYLVTRDRRIIDINEKLCSTLGFTREELIGLELPWPFTPPEGRDVSYAVAGWIRGQALGGRTGFSEPIELPLMRKDGTRFIGEVTVSPARARDGTVLAWVSTIRDVSRRHDHEVELERLATHDPLTGLANRRLFEERLEQEMADAIRHGRSLAVAILDLDHFKKINDRHGHPVGDRVLCEAAARLDRVLRKGEVLARVGGEEFGWILPEANADGARAAAERARHAISDHPFEGIGRMTISVGIALRGELEEAALLYEHADQSLYRAKREGRDRSIIWGASR